jgi:hypothetical protein
LHLIFHAMISKKLNGNLGSEFKCCLMNNFNFVLTCYKFIACLSTCANLSIKVKVSFKFSIALQNKFLVNIKIINFLLFQRIKLSLPPHHRRPRAPLNLIMLVSNLCISFHCSLAGRKRQKFHVCCPQSLREN